ncbi:glutamate--cysteine ligase family protein [Marinobacterium jannaschii]|uniref:glutamate--cysteine ligase n=1 Tax=Marinobacterium jannaschii TaxID=64970 RepID=UPI0004848C86|nr:glutamate--cysteine ligase [Marinobacterium jannaschii]
MGYEIDTREFTQQDYQRFQDRLLDQLEELRALLASHSFGQGPGSIGAELELSITDQQGRALAINQDIQSRVNDPLLALELNRFNLEYNLTPVAAAGMPFSALETEICAVLGMLNDAAAEQGGKVVPIGILPTLKRSDFGVKAMTNQSRYHVLTRELRRLRGRMFAVRINGPEPISLRAQDVSLEGANTSLQLHYRVTPQRFADLFNAMQLVTPLLLAVGSNSPFLLGHRLWHETRVPLFKQAIDGRPRNARDQQLPSRVDFGTGWVRRGAYELFAETVHLHPPLIPLCRDVPSNNGEAPELFELRLHQGTVWPWNRAIYDPADGGHIRIEMRALPSGPSPCDMVANAALAIGLAEALSDDIEQLIPGLPFATMDFNFYRAAECGIGAQLLWPDPDGHPRLTPRPVKEIVQGLLPRAAQGLQQIGVDQQEISFYLDIISKRLELSATGARWQMRQVKRLSQRQKRHRALSTMLHHYMRNVAENQPVANWGELR